MKSKYVKKLLALLVFTSLTPLALADATTYQYRNVLTGLRAGTLETVPPDASPPPVPTEPVSSCVAGNRLFTVSGSFQPEVEAPGCTNFKVLIVGGGAGGARGYHGAGGSGFVVFKAYSGLLGSIPVTVGKGGLGRGGDTSAADAIGFAGLESKFGTDKAAGGRSNSSWPGGGGGSGGGASGRNSGNHGHAGGQGGSSGLPSASEGGGAGQGAGTFALAFANFKQIAFSSGAGGAGGVAAANGGHGGGGGGGGVVVSGQSIQAGATYGTIGGKPGVGFGAGGGSGGSVPSGYWYGGGFGASGMVYVEWE